MAVAPKGGPTRRKGVKDRRKKPGKKPNKNPKLTAAQRRAATEYAKRAGEGLSRTKFSPSAAKKLANKGAMRILMGTKSVAGVAGRLALGTVGSAAFLADFIVDEMKAHHKEHGKPTALERIRKSKKKTARREAVKKGRKTGHSSWSAAFEADKKNR